MDSETRQRYLTWALRAFGLLFILGVYPLTVLWPSGWAWHTGPSSEYLQMIIAIYATLGVFLLLASRQPSQHIGLIAFTIWSSIVHGGVMAVQSLANVHHIGHLYGDVPALFIAAAVLGWLCPRALMLQLSKPSD
jgi:FtsH-binding integral membrane protein